MTHNPDYKPVPRHQVQGGLLRASDTDRDATARTLSEAFSDGRLNREEYDARLDQAMNARTIGELEPLTVDLLPGQRPAPAPPQQQRPGQGWELDTVNANPTSDVVFTMFGGTERKGRFRLRRKTGVFTMFGGTDLDLQNAVFESNVCEIDVFCMFGGVDVIVPDGVAVRNEAIAIFGGAGTSHVTPPEPGAPTVVVRGFVAFGGVDAKGPKRRRG